MRLINVSINRKVLHQIFQNKRLFTKDISENTLKTLKFLSNVIEMKYKSKKLPENRRSPEAIQMQSDMSHMRLIGRRPGSGGRSKISEEIKRIVDEMMEEDDETSAYQIRHKLCAMGYNLSLRIILRCRQSLGWNHRGGAYCQMIRDVNKVKRLEWAKKHENDDFEDVIWTDKSTIQMETHCCFCCRKQSQKPRYKPRSVKLR